MIFQFNKIKVLSKSYKTKHENKFQKYEKPEPNICAKKISKNLLYKKSILKFRIKAKESNCWT